MHCLVEGAGRRREEGRGGGGISRHAHIKRTFLKLIAQLFCKTCHEAKHHYQHPSVGVGRGGGGGGGGEGGGKGIMRIAHRARPRHNGILTRPGARPGHVPNGSKHAKQRLIPKKRFWF